MFHVALEYVPCCPRECSMLPRSQTAHGIRASLDICHLLTRRYFTCISDTSNRTYIRVLTASIDLLFALYSAAKYPSYKPMIASINLLFALYSAARYPSYKPIIASIHACSYWARYLFKLFWLCYCCAAVARTL
jgi:hypothetical protein